MPTVTRDLPLSTRYTIAIISYTESRCAAVIKCITLLFVLNNSLQNLESGECDHPVTVGLTPANKPLNRFNNIAVCESKQYYNRGTNYNAML